MRTASSPPAPATSLIGRIDDVAAVRALLAGARLVTLTGPPGVGKTRLALAVAAEEAVWVELTPLRDARHVLPEITRVVDVAADENVLLVLDNCEHLLDAAPDIAELLRSTVRLTVLATSRERLRLAAEREYAVPPLQMPGDREVDDWTLLQANPAVAVLLSRAPPTVSIDRHTARALADICVRLDGLPLALELAAARLRVFSPAELAHRLEHGMPSLSHGTRDAPARHRDLRAAIAWSHDLLSERDRTVFARLSIFPNDWTMAAADAVCAEPDLVASVESLLDKSLVSRVATDESGSRFAMLMSLREFAADQLDAGDAARARRRHAAHFAERAREWERTVGTADENLTWALFGKIRADLRAAFEHSRDHDEVDATLWLAAALGWYAYTRGTLSAVRPLIEQIDVSAGDATASVPARTAATLVGGVLAFGLREMDSAETFLRTCADLALRHGDDRRRAIALAFTGHVARDRGAFDVAREHYLIVRDLYAGEGNTRGTAWAAHDLGLLAIETGADAEAAVLLREAVREFEATDYTWASASATRGLAVALLRSGESAEAAVLLRRALSLHDQVGDRRGVAECIEALAEHSFARGDARLAARLAGAARALRTRGVAPPTEAERARLAESDARVTIALGDFAADHEYQAGRTMPYDGVLELAARVAAPEDAAASAELTPRQWQVAALVADGSTNRQIGRHLGITEKTTEIHVHNIMERLHVPSRAGVATWMARHGDQARRHVTP